MNKVPAIVAEGYAALDGFEAQRRAGEAGIIRTIAHLADHYRVDTSVVLDGMEAVIFPGGEGSGGVGEFLALEISARLGISPDAALSKIGDVLAVRDRFPALWEMFFAGNVEWWQAADVAARCSELGFDAARYVDAEIAKACHYQPWTRVRRHIDQWIMQADTELARRKAAQEQVQRGVWIDDIHDGNVNLRAKLAPRHAALLDHTLNELAKEQTHLVGIVDPTTGEEYPFQDVHQMRRAEALGILARQAVGQDTLPQHQLIVHIDAHSYDSLDETAQVEQWGPLLTEHLTELLAESKVTVRPVIDIRNMNPSDAYQVPDQMRFAIEQRNPIDVFPYGSQVSRACDLDHTQPFQPGVPGQTRPDNLGPLSRRTHRAKTHGGWQLDQPQPGTFRWRSPGGAEFVVTAQGTLRVDHPHLHPPGVDRPPGHRDSRTRQPTILIDYTYT